MEMEDNHEREGVSAAGEGEGLSVETPYGGEAESAADSVDQDIPSAFVEGAGIAAKQTFLLRYDEGEWEAAMTNRNVMKYSFTRGWGHFLKYNQLKIGDILLFKFVGDNVIDVVMMEEEAGRNLIGQSRSGGFLEPI